MKLAKENTPRIFPARITPMLEMLGEEADLLQNPLSEEDVPLMVLTNAGRLHGAACMLYPGMLEGIGEKKQDGFYIIPSSIHEVLILDKTGMGSPEEMKGMIREVNAQHVAAEEILSDNLYYFDVQSGTIKIIL